MKFLRLLVVPFALLVVLAARLGLPIRFGMIWSSRIGHMAGNMECYLCEREAGLSKGWDFWFHGSNPCSVQLDRMLRRVIRIDDTGFVRICALVNELFPGKEKHGIDTANVDRDIHNLMEKQKPHLYFPAEEREFGVDELRRMGIPYGSKWVCLIVRDSAYLPQLAYHSYRDSDVDTYVQAAEALAERGYYVVRMGIKVEKPLKSNHPRVIDYATNGKHTDFRSMYLGAHCAFALSNGCGIDSIPVIFRKPICYVNYVPVEYLQTYNKGSLAIWKHHEKEGKRMTLKEIYESKCGHFMAAEDFKDAGITLVDNTPEEITAVALEMVERVESAAQPYPQAFWATFPRSVSTHNDKPLHGEIRMRIGREFLKGYS